MRNMTSPRKLLVLSLISFSMIVSLSTPLIAQESTGTSDSTSSESNGSRRRSSNTTTEPQQRRNGAGNLSLKTYVGEGEASVLGRELSSRSMVQRGETQQLWDPPAWLASCDIDVLSFAEFSGRRSVIADYYRSQVDAVYVEDNAEWVVMGCVGEGARVVRGVPGSTVTWSGVAYPVGTAPPTAVVDWLIADALAKVRVPVQAGSSAPNGEDQPMLYQLEAVAWVDPGVWQSVSASSQTFAGGTTVTVTATPLRATFEALPNDGEESSFADCGDWANETWTAARDQALVAQGCTVTFGKAADDHVLRSELTWGLAWSCTCGLADDFNGQTIVRVNERPVEVVEYLVVES